MKTGMWWLAVPVLPLVTSLGFSPPQTAPPVPIGYVSAQRLSAESNQGREAVAKVQALRRERAAEVQQKRRALEATRAQLPLATGEARARLDLQEQEQRADLERSAGRARSAIQALERQTNADILAKVRIVAAEIARERGLKAVLNQESAIVWADPELDLTDAIVARMNATPK